MENNNFLYVFKNVLKEKNLYLDVGPNYFVDRWDEFVSLCKEGYSFSASEYDYDLIIRDEIEKILQASALQGFEEFKLFKDKVQLLDNEFKMCLHPFFKLPTSSESWWSKGVLKYARQAYAEQIKKHFDYDIEVIN